MPNSLLLAASLLNLGEGSLAGLVVALLAGLALQLLELLGSLTRRMTRWSLLVTGGQRRASW